MSDADKVMGLAMRVAFCPLDAVISKVPPGGFRFALALVALPFCLVTLLLSAPVVFFGLVLLIWEEFNS